mgnify:CR=1 FL=1
MNKVVLMGRLTADPEVRYTQGENPMAVARYTLAVNRRFKRNSEQEADFIRCIAFGKQAEFVEKYLKKAIQILIVGRIQTGSYTKDGVKVYTTDVVVEEHNFTESKGSQNRSGNNAGQNQNHGNASTNNANQSPNRGNNSVPSGNTYPDDGFMNIPDGLEEELPFA